MKLDFALATERDEGSRRPASELKPGSGPRFGITTGPIDALEEFSNNVIQLGLTRDGKPDPSVLLDLDYWAVLPR